MGILLLMLVQVKQYSYRIYIRAATLIVPNKITTSQPANNNQPECLYPFLGVNVAANNISARAIGKIKPLMVPAVTSRLTGFPNK